MGRFRNLGLFALSFAVMTLASLAFAEEPLITDRPDFTESSSAVGSGVLQLESGFSHAEFRGGSDVTTVGEILARWGVLDKLPRIIPVWAVFLGGVYWLTGRKNEVAEAESSVGKEDHHEH